MDTLGLTAGTTRRGRDPTAHFGRIDGERGLKAFDVSVIGDRAPSFATSGRASAPADDEGLCDVLTTAELRVELTELILEAAPDLTGAHILKLRESLLAFARKHGWSED
ncbi:hypothetical protein [Actinomadura latina]|uniref:Uncharacterized protein n=1 Tax=Actinomadura latina TaxID=163603 RepID=A0A846Z3H7_9ACTN|nr:hypothetical protein [Actinomadura latina]NKZ05258.1 hypothetical protein [Actinomadura latina]